MKKILAVLAVLLIIFLGSHRTNAQIFKFQHFNANREGGLCHNFVYSIAQDKHGFIWFATGLGLCRFDGFRFIPSRENLPTVNVSTSFRDNDGNLWFGYQDGSIVKYDGVDFSIADTSANTIITQITQAPNGEILAAMQTGGIIRIDKKIHHFTKDFEQSMINAICFADKNRLMVGTHDGLYLYHYGSDEQELALVSKDENLSYLSVNAIVPKVNGNGYWVATENDGVFFVTVDENHFSSLRLDIPGLDMAYVQSIHEDLQGNLWISTFHEGLFRVQFSLDMRILKTSIYNSSNGLGSDFVKQSFTDIQQNLWVATFGNGAACITNTAFSFFEDLNLAANNATAVFSTDNSEYWIAGMGTIIRIVTQPEEVKTVWGIAEGLPNENITALRTDDEGNLWIGTERSGIFKLAKDAKNVIPFYREQNSLSNIIQNFVFDDETIWVATRNGVFHIDKLTGRVINQYATFDGDLPHNDIRDIFKDSKDRVWIATNSNSLIDVKNNHRLTVSDYMETKFSVITQDEQGRIWAGTIEEGVFVFDEDNDTIRHFTTDNELMSNFCYAMAPDGNGQMWIGHRMGLSSINTLRYTINTFGVDNGIHGDVNNLAMVLNKNGEMLIGMTDGVMMYDVKADKPKDIVPMLNLSRVLINDIPYHTLKPIVLPYGKYKIQFDFVGLQYSNPNSISYQYMLLGYDEWGWSPLSRSNSAIYPRVENGEYSFWVRACNSDACTGDIMLFSIKIRNPWWKTWWSMMLMLSAMIGLGYVVIAIRERNHRIQQEYLENELKARTKEVRKQKEEIDVINRDITDSINYAQRIQFSMLPSTSILMEHCSDAFIFYRPRNIVSGDFYWFEFFPKTNRLLIACADATGHGVPGAFMSLIGTTLIKDIAIRPDVNAPSEILYRLDENIQSTLNQNTDSEGANDGMDIIVCEINTQTQLARISSAMRPYIIYRNGVPTTYRSSRASIGGQYYDNKVFDTTEIQLSKGDTIYMFTDGYTDQFGGPSCKKLKINRLQSILDDIHKRDMEEQHRVIKTNFDLWKGANSQLDDVLVIGVRI